MAGEYFNSDTPFGLLPWQISFLFYILGLLSLQYPVPAVFSAGLLFFIQHRSNKLVVPLWLGMLCMLAGYGLANLQFPQEDIQVPQWMSAREKVQIKAEVDKVEPKPGERIQVILSEPQFQTEDGNKGYLPGKVVWKWNNPDIWPSPGQKVQARFRLEPVRGLRNPGTWDNRFFWKKKGVYYRTYTESSDTEIEIRGEESFLWSLRLQLREHLIEHTPQGQGQGLLLGLVMGDRSKLSYSTLDTIRRASLAHSLALSGLHLGFLITIAWLFACLIGVVWPKTYLQIPRSKLAILLAIPLVLAYVWLGQARPSLLRASLMFFFWGVLLLRGRQKVLLDGLFFAVFCILLFRPLDIYDISLQLSCVAVAGIVLFWPHLYSCIKSLFPSGRFMNRILIPLAGILGISLIANLVLLPLTVWNFGRVTLDIYTNLFWLPLLGWVVLPLGLFGMLLSLLPGCMILSGGCLYAAETVLSNMLQVLHYMDDNGLVHVMVALRPIWQEVVGFWILSGIGAIFWKKIGKIPWWLVILGFVLIVYPGLKRELSALESKIELQVLDIGQGQSVCMEYYKGKRILVDGGGSWNKDFDLGKFALAPALTRNRPPRLEKVILTHSDYDHLRGLFYILENFRVREFVYNGDWPDGWDKERLKKALSESGAETKTICRGGEIALDKECNLKILHPGKSCDLKKDNDKSLVLGLRHAGKGLALLPGDLEKPGIERVLSRNASLQAELLLVPHHGSRKSMSGELYSRVDPEVAVISCGYLNYFRFPHQEVIEGLKKTGADVHTTSAEGQIRIVWDLEQNDKKVCCYSD